MIHDPARGVRQLTSTELSDHMTGVALELTPTARFERRRDVERVGLAALVGRAPGFTRAIGRRWRFLIARSSSANPSTCRSRWTTPSPKGIAAFFSG